ncbi:MAG: FtsK/SpoIIIE domain-containing protein [Acidimicrobiales bacterium]
MLRLRVVDAQHDGERRDVEVARPDDAASVLVLLRRLAVEPRGITELWLDGSLIDATTSVGALGVCDGSVLTVCRAGAARPVIDGDLPRRRRQGPHLRPADVGVLPVAAPVELPAAPREPKPAPSFPWLMALAPLPVAGVMIVFLGPRMAVFAALGPLMVIARHFEGRRTARRDARRHAEELATAVAGLDEELEARRRDELAVLAARHLTDDARLELAASGSRLWARRAADPAALEVRVGTADLPWTPPIAQRAGGGDRQAVFGDSIERHSTLPGAPLTIDLGDTALGIVGPAAGRHALARSVIAGLVVQLGPADLAITLSCATTAASPISTGWDALKWLPHQVVTSDGDDAAVGGVPWTVVIHDDASRFRTGSFDRLGETGVARIVLADAVDALPAWCERVIRLGDDGATIGGDGSWRRFVPDLVEVDHLDRVARRLAPVSDPEARTVRSNGAGAVTPLALHGPCHSHELLRRWTLADPGALLAIIGAGPGGAVRLDLVADGPHVLAAGTTGAGKSELLRSLVLSLACHQPPSDCELVLVDYKGGGAFDACAELPHTVAVVTDLDEHESARALRGLKAELRRREELLRAAGAHDFVTLRRSGGALARLVIIVDEFATLAAELPGFLDSLVDVAQRGRSLGIHLVLATQRPAGVLDNKIRANTNLRICLRVQDANDSVDLLGTDVASRIDRSAHGAGYVRFGDGQVEPFRAAYSGAGLRVGGDAPIAAPFLLAEAVTPGDVWDAAPVTELEALVRRIGEAAAASSSTAGSPPWLPPLPSRLPSSALPAARGGAVGILDDPDRQARRALAHGFDDGNLLVLGLDGDVTAATVVAVSQALLTSDSTDSRHLYRLTDRAAVGPWLPDLPAHGATVDVNDFAAIERLVALLERRVAEQQPGRRAGVEAAPTATEIVVAADGLGTLYERAGDAGERELVARLNALLRDGPSAGLRFVAAARSVRSLPSLARAALPTVWFHRLTDPADATAYGVRPRDLPDLDAHAVFDPAVGLAGVVADPSPLRPVDLPPCAEAPERLATVGPLVTRAEVDAAGSIDGDVLRLPIGLDLDRGEPAVLELRAHRPALVVGGPGTGTSQLLRRIAEEAASLGLRTLRLSPGTEASEELDTATEPTVVVADDADQLDDAALTWLNDRSLAPRWIVVAADPGPMRRATGPLRAVRGAHSGVVLGLTDPPTDLFASAFPKRRPEPSTPGRGWLVGRTGALAIQAISD